MNRVPVIEFRDVSFAYHPSVPAITGATFEVHHRELLSVVGPNGGGKTTLLNLILGVIEPDSGEVRVFGERPQAVRHRIGYMPQFMRFDPQFPVTVQDVVLMGRLGRSRKLWHTRSDRNTAGNLLEELELGSLARRQFAHLSGGQRQRVLIARALASEPDLLLLDEPTANVDVRAESQFMDILKTLSRRMAVLLVSHDLGFVCEFVQKVICVNRRVAVHPTCEITGDMIKDMYGSEIRMVRHDHHH